MTRSYLEVPVDAFDNLAYATDADSNGTARVVFNPQQSPNLGFVYQIERIAVATSDGSDATWSVYLPNTGGPLNAFTDLRDRFGPVSGGSFPYDPKLRMTQGRILVVRATGFTVGQVIMARFSGIIAKIETGEFITGSRVVQAADGG